MKDESGPILEEMQNLNWILMKLRRRVLNQQRKAAKRQVILLYVQTTDKVDNLANIESEVRKINLTSD